MPPAATRFIDPAVLTRIADLELLARGVVEGFVAGLHKSPYKGFSVEFMEYRPYMPGDDPAPRRLEALRPHGPVLHQGVRGRDEHGPPPPPRRERVDGVRLGPGDEVRLRLVPHRRPRLPHHPPARRRRPRPLRQRGPPPHPPTQHEGPPPHPHDSPRRRHAGGADVDRTSAPRAGRGGAAARLRRPSSPTSSTSPRPRSTASATSGSRGTRWSSSTSSTPRKSTSPSTT